MGPDRSSRETLPLGVDEEEESRGSRPAEGSLLWLDRTRRWIGILSAFFSAQIVVQILTFGSGLLIVRELPVSEFALYTLATSMLTFLSFSSNLGATSAFAYFFREAGTDVDRRARSFRAVLDVRYRLILIALPVAGGAFLWFSARRDFSAGSVAVALLVLMATAWVGIGSIAGIDALRLQSRFFESYKAELCGASVRLSTVVLVLFLGWLRATTALAAALVAQLVTWAMSKPGRQLAATEEDSSSERKAVYRFLIPTLPAEVHAAFQGPIIVWLAAVLGSTQGVAEVGALSRLSQLMALLSGLAGVVFIPRLARISDDREYRSRFLTFLGFLVVSVAVAVSIAWYGRAWLLGLLGANYAGLELELLLLLSGSGLSVIASFAIWVNAARSWKRLQAYLTMTLFAFQVVYVILIPLRVTTDFLVFGLVNSSIICLLQLGNVALGLVRPSLVRW